MFVRLYIIMAFIIYFTSNLFPIKGMWETCSHMSMTSYNMLHIIWHSKDDYTHGICIYHVHIRQYAWWYHSLEPSLALNSFKNRCQNFGKILFTQQKRASWKIFAKWHLPKRNLPKIIIILYKVPNLIPCNNIWDFVFTTFLIFYAWKNF